MIQNLRSSVSSPLNGKYDIARFSINESLLNQDIPNQVKGQRSKPNMVVIVLIVIVVVVVWVLPFEFWLKSDDKIAILWTNEIQTDREI